MGLAILFLILGLVAIALELFTPGGFFAVLGALLIMGGVIVFANATESIAGGFIFFISSLALVFLVIIGMMQWIKKGRLRGSIYAPDNQEGYVASSWDKNLVGKKGIVSTELRPGGHIKVEGRPYTAVSQSGFIDKGESVEIIGGEGETLFVKRI